MDKLEFLRDNDYQDAPPTKWDLFEAMDRVSTLSNQLHDSLCNHRGLNDEQARKASQAFSLLFEIYQSAGERFFEATKDEE